MGNSTMFLVERPRVFCSFSGNGYRIFVCNGMLISYVLISDVNVNPQSLVYVALRHDERRQPGELRRVPLQKLLDGLVKGR